MRTGYEHGNRTGLTNKFYTQGAKARVRNFYSSIVTTMDLSGTQTIITSGQANKYNHCSVTRSILIWKLLYKAQILAITFSSQPWEV
jgi:hypothetical protein